MINAFKNLEDVNCSICLDCIIGCRVAACGHTFCNNCLTECLIRKKVKFDLVFNLLDLSCMQERYQKIKNCEEQND